MRIHGTLRFPRQEKNLAPREEEPIVDYHDEVDANPFRIRTYEKFVRKSRRISTYKTLDVKSFRIRTYTKR